MKLFENSFRKLFEADDSSLESALSGDLSDDLEDTEANQLANGLEEDLSGGDTSDVAEMTERLKGELDEKIKKGNEKIAEWASDIEKFAAFVNDASNEKSMRHIIDNAGVGSVLYAVKQNAGNDMTKVATQCAVLAQKLKSLVGTVTVDTLLSKK